MKSPLKCVQEASLRRRRQLSYHSRQLTFPGMSVKKAVQFIDGTQGQFLNHLDDFWSKNQYFVAGHQNVQPTVTQQSIILKKTVSADTVNPCLRGSEIGLCVRK